MKAWAANSLWIVATTVSSIAACGCATRPTTLFPATLDLPLAPGDKQINCQREFDQPPAAAYLANMECVQPHQGMTEASLQHYADALSAAGARVMPALAPLTDARLLACWPQGKTTLLVLSKRAADLIGDFVVEKRTLEPGQKYTRTKEEEDRIIDEAWASLPIGIHHDASARCETPLGTPR